MPTPRLPVLLACVLSLATAAVAGETVSDSQLGFRFTVPDGFVPVPKQVQEDVIYAYQRPASDGQSGNTFILIERMDGVLDRKEVTPQQVAAKNPQITVSTEKWKTFDLQVFRVPEQVGEIQSVTLNAPVPLAPNAIQVSVVGRADREAELRSLLRSVLSSLDGKTNWQTQKELQDWWAKLYMYGGVVIAIIVAAVIGFIRNRKQKRPPPNGSKQSTPNL